jgi:hypothetical protein
MTGSEPAEGASVRDQVKARLAQLTEEHDTGRRMLADLDVRREELQRTLLRIGGAIQVLGELLDPSSADDGTTTMPVPEVAVG